MLAPGAQEPWPGAAKKAACGFGADASAASTAAAIAPGKGAGNATTSPGRGNCAAAVVGTEADMFAKSTIGSATVPSNITSSPAIERSSNSLATTPIASKKSWSLLPTQCACRHLKCPTANNSPSAFLPTPAGKYLVLLSSLSSLSPVVWSCSHGQRMFIVPSVFQDLNQPLCSKKWVVLSSTLLGARVMAEWATRATRNCREGLILIDANRNARLASTANPCENGDPCQAEHARRPTRFAAR